MKWIEIELFPPILSIYFIHVQLSALHSKYKEAMKCLFLACQLYRF